MRLKKYLENWESPTDTGKLTEASKCPKCGKQTNVTYAQKHGKHKILCDKCEDLRRKGK